MSIHQVHARIELEIARLAKSPAPAPDRVFIEGMIEMAEHLGQLPPQDAESYRQVLAVKFGNRVVQLRSAA